MLIFGASYIEYLTVVNTYWLTSTLKTLPKSGNIFEIRVHNYSVICITVYPKKSAHGFVVPCFVVVMQSFIMNPHEVCIHIHQGCFAGTGAIVRLPQSQWSKPDGYGKISQCITTTKHSKAKTVCIFLGIYCMLKEDKDDDDNDDDYLSPSHYLQQFWSMSDMKQKNHRYRSRKIFIYI